MTLTLSSACKLSDRDLLDQLVRAIGEERQTTAQVVTLLMEVDARKLYAKQGFSSMFSYCVQMLHFSEHAAYPHLTPAITSRSSTRRIISKRQVEQLVASLHPQRNVPAVVRKLPTPKPPTILEASNEAPADGERSTELPPTVAPTYQRRPEIKPLAPERFKVQFTVNRTTYEKLRRVQDLLRHSVPSGDPAAIFDRALTLLLADLSKTKHAAVKCPRPTRAARHDSRHIPAGVKREVWQRDAGRCAFRGREGRCSETGFLEFHHVIPYARGGATTTENLELRCRAHNAYEAEQSFGHRVQPPYARETAAAYGSCNELGPDRVCPRRMPL